tara:strand:+ start:49715 stop:50536 length:822 start_codon:yes stop_codon:yes gene_type:complete
MKSVAAASIGDYERAVMALGDYFATVERGLGACFRDPDLQPAITTAFNTQSPPCMIVFGTDQGLVGQFNDSIAEFALNFLEASLLDQPASHKPLVWTVGERLNERLNDAGITTQARFDVPDSVKSISPLIGQILLSIEAHHPITVMSELHLFYQRPGNGPVYSPITQRLLPLDQNWCKKLAEKIWPTNNIPELLGDKPDTLGALIREYLFVSLFRASAESLSSENASRLAAMQRADKNIEDLLETLNRDYHRKRQASIDEEMFDVIAGANNKG